MSELDHLLTPAQKRARKKEEKQNSMLREMGIAPREKTKVRRKRKPMSPEQKAAAVERLASARAKKNKGKAPNCHPDVADLDDSHPLNFEKSKQTLKDWRERLRAMRLQKDSKDSSARSEFQIAQTYVKNLSTYIKDGVYLDHKYGAEREGTMNTICLVPAKNPDGTIKRNIGTYYSDIDEVWNHELAKEYA